MKLDTPKSVRHLTGAGMDHAHARAIASGIADIHAAGRATNSDLRELRSELKTDMAELRSELKGEISELRGEMKGDFAGLDVRLTGLRGELKGDIAALEVRIARQHLMMVFAIVSLTVGLIKFLP